MLVMRILVVHLVILAWKLLVHINTLGGSKWVWISATNILLIQLRWSIWVKSILRDLQAVYNLRTRMIVPIRIGWNECFRICIELINMLWWRLLHLRTVIYVLSKWWEWVKLVSKFDWSSWNTRHIRIDEGRVDLRFGHLIKGDVLWERLLNTRLIGVANNRIPWKAVIFKETGGPFDIISRLQF